jgi:hypothetical protein
MRTLFFILIFTCLSSFAAEWTELSKLGGVGHKVVVSYDSLNKKLKLQHRSGIFGRTHEEIFDVSNTVLVDEVTNKVEKILTEAKVPNETLSKSVDEVSNLKYLDGSSCHIVNFSTTTPESYSELGPLLSKISEKLDDSSGGVQSHFLFNIQADDGDPIELRAITNSEGDIVQFSLFSESRDLTNFSVEKSFPYFNILKSGEHIFSLEIDEKNKSHISILKVKDDGVQNIDRVHLRIESTKKGLKTYPYSNNKKREYKESSTIDLRKKIVAYEEVAQIDDSSRFYKSLEEDEVQYIFGDSNSSNEDVNLIKHSFLKCMDEKYLVSVEKDLEQDDFRNACLNESRFEVVAQKIDESLSDQIKNELLLNYKECLIQEKVLLRHKKLMVFDPKAIDKKGVASNCINELQSSIVREQMLQDTFNDDELLSVLSTQEQRSELKIFLAQSYNDCLKSSSADKCSTLTKGKVGREAFKLKLISSDIKIKDTKAALSSRIDNCNDSDCLKSIYIESRKEAQQDEFKKIYGAVFSTKGISISDEDLESFENRVAICLEGESLTKMSSLETFSRMKDLEVECQMKAFSKTIPSYIASKVLEKEPFSLMEGEDKKKLQSKFNREIKKILRGSVLLGDIQDKIEGLEEELLPTFLEEYVESRTSNKKLSSSDIETLEERVVLTLSGDSKKGIKENLKSTFKSQRDKGRTIDPLLFVKDTIKSFEIEIHNVANKGVGHEEYKACLNKYSSKWNSISFKSYRTKCENKVFASTFFDKKKKDFSDIISANFPLYSNEGNDLFSVVSDFENCVDEQSILIEDKKVFESRLNTCFRLNKLRLQRKISKLNLEKNKALFTIGEQKELLESSKECYENFSLHLIRTARKNDSKEVSDKFTIDALSDIYNSSSDSPSLVNTLSNSKSFSDDYVDNYIKSCEKFIEKRLYESISDFALKRVSLTVGNKVDVDPEIMRKVFDEEIIREILKLDKKSTSSSPEYSSNPLDMKVTGKMSINSLVNLISVVGEYIGKGFVFDKDLMKTELVVFRSELKRALRWINKQNREVTLEELKGFFADSKLADVLAYSVVSEQVYNRFEEFISAQEQEQRRELIKKFGTSKFSKFSKAEKNEWNRMLMKYSRMRKDAKSMTSSYDFRRLFRDGSESSKAKLNKIKTTYLLPLLTNGKATPAAKEEVISIVADLILKDNANGGFAGKFTSASAIEILKNDEDSRWAITKWLFYDEGDFDWDTIKSTKSGGEAIDYYAKYILLPKILKQRVSKFSKNYRMNHFKKLLDKAQSEND